jgi:hypothetical protein
MDVVTVAIERNGSVESATAWVTGTCGVVAADAIETEQMQTTAPTSKPRTIVRITGCSLRRLNGMR